MRVLDGRGVGQTSDVIAGIDWVIANRVTRNIKVMNLSLGAASSESYLTDPLCRAVRRATAAGITVVAAAGNFGSTTSGLEQYGSITAPGNDPTVITVGAVNTHQSDSRNDESITYFSSRGPTRGYSLDSAGVKGYDNLLKPDLVAPGNRIVAAESAGSWLVDTYLHLHDSGTGTRAFMQLSGSSIAAPAVAGAVALMLQKNPGLTPPLVKAILQYTAELLVEAAEQLRRAVEDHGMLSRIAGGEFVCLLAGLGAAEAASLGEQAQGLLDRLTVEVRSGQLARVGLSFGVAAYPADGGSIDELLHTAAAAARKRKDSRKHEDAPHYVSKELRLVSPPQPLASNQ